MHTTTPAVERVEEVPPQEWASLLFHFGLLPRAVGLGPGFLRSPAAQLEGLAPALPVYSEPHASGGTLPRLFGGWLCVIVWPR